MDRKQTSEDFPLAFKSWDQWSGNDIVPQTFGDRRLFDFFDFHGVYGGVYPNYKRDWELDALLGKDPEVEFTLVYRYNGLVHTSREATRPAAEEALFMKCFSVVEDKLRAEEKVAARRRKRVKRKVTA